MRSSIISAWLVLLTATMVTILYAYYYEPNGSNQGYRDRYDIIDHGHEKTTFMCFFHRYIFTEIRGFATIVFKLVINFGV